MLLIIIMFSIFGFGYSFVLILSDYGLESKDLILFIEFRNVDFML